MFPGFAVGVRCTCLWRSAGRTDAQHTTGRARSPRAMRVETHTLPCGPTRQQNVATILYTRAVAQIGTDRHTRNRFGYHRANGFKPGAHG